MQVPKRSDEEARLEALERYQILDTEREASFDEITRLVSHLCDAPVAAINLIDRDRQWFKSEVGLGVQEIPLSESICAHALPQPDLFVVSNMLEDPRFAQNPWVIGEPHLRFYAGAPLTTPDGYAIGTLCVLDYKPRVLTDHQMELLRIMARQLMTQLELRRIVAALEDTVEKHKESESALILLHEKESLIAETLQRTMLLVPPADRFPGLAVAMKYEAALEESLVGGDFFDAFSISGDKVALVIGDVSGKGLAAAARTAEVKYALRAYLDAVMSPEYALEQVNDFICHMQAGRHDSGFVVITLVIVETLTGNCSINNAGTEPCLILRSDGTIDRVHTHGQPVGVGPASYTESNQVLGPDDTLILVTDGLTESRFESKFFEMEGIEGAICAAGTEASVAVIADMILESAKAFAGGKMRDDACIVVARLRQLSP